MDAWVVEALRVGYLIPFDRLPPLSERPLSLPAYSPQSIRGVALTQELQNLLRKGAVEPALRFSSACSSDSTLEFLPCEEGSGGPQVVLILGLSAGAAAPCLFHAGACGLFLCGLLEEVFYSVFLSSACSFLFMAFSRQLAAFGVLFIVSSTACCLNGSVLCSSSSQLSFSFPANVGWGPAGVLPFGPCEFSYAFCSSFAPCSVPLPPSPRFLFAFLNDCGFAFLSGSWPSCCSGFICMSVMFEEFLFVISSGTFSFSRCFSRFLVFLWLLRQFC